MCKSFLSFFHPFRLVGHFISFFCAIVLFFKLLVTNESLQEKKKTIRRILSFLLHVFVNIEQKLTEEMNLFAFKIVRFCFIHMVYSWVHCFFYLCCDINELEKFGRFSFSVLSRARKSHRQTNMDCFVWYSRWNRSFYSKSNIYSCARNYTN